jgi:lipopolysaccharide cholinephosphotransferase
MVALKHNPPDSFLDSEPREILIDSEMKKIWAVELDLLSEFDRVCTARNLKYTLAYGTLLGAVRHKGFIPWDNDVDVIMLREEFDKLCACAEDEFSEPYFFQSDATVVNACRGHAQLRNSATTGILRCEMVSAKPVYEYNQGIFLDIFVLDNVPKDENVRKEFFHKIKKLKRKISRVKKCLGAYAARSRIRGLSVSRILTGMFISLKDKVNGKELLIQLNRELESLCRVYSKAQDTLVSPVMFSPEIAAKECYEREIFEDVIDAEFEHRSFKIVRRYDEILKQKYGNYHKHIVGGDVHGGVLFDIEHPYTKYL